VRFRISIRTKYGRHFVVDTFDLWNGQKIRATGGLESIDAAHRYIGRIVRGEDMRPAWVRRAQGLEVT
jgi:hypothetical protein